MSIAGRDVLANQVMMATCGRWLTMMMMDDGGVWCVVCGDSCRVRSVVGGAQVPEESGSGCGST